MTNEIIKAPALQLSTLSDMQNLGKVFVESGMFTDVKNVAQAVVRILAGKEIGIEPFAAMSGIFIIAGKTTIGAGLMANRIKASGKYDYKVVQLDDNICSIDFFEGKSKIGNSTFTKADAVKAQTKNLEKFPRNMLFARAVSNGLRWFCADVFDRPVYTREEMEDTTVDIPHEVMPETAAAEPVVTEPKPPKVMNALGLKKALATIEAGDLKTWPSVAGSYSVTEEQLAKLNEAAFTNALPRVKAGEDGVLDAIRLWPLTDEQKSEIEGSGMPF